MSYDKEVVGFCKEVLVKLKSRVMNPGWGWDADAHCPIPEGYTEDQQTQTFELMWFAGYQVGFYKYWGEETIGICVRGTVADPWAYRMPHQIFHNSPRTPEQSEETVNQYLKNLTK